jgi:hypothetical protein
VSARVVDVCSQGELQFLLAGGVVFERQAMHLGVQIRRVHARLHAGSAARLEIERGGDGLPILLSRGQRAQLPAD